MRLIDADLLFQNIGDVKPKNKTHYEAIGKFMSMITNSPTVEAQWIPVSERLPSKSGTYLVTGDSMRHGMVDIFHYGKPLMPNIAVKGMCWYRDDDEWGDVVYDDKDIFAWMPLPEPYREDGEDDGED